MPCKGNSATEIGSFLKRSLRPFSFQQDGLFRQQSYTRSKSTWENPTGSFERGAWQSSTHILLNDDETRSFWSWLSSNIRYGNFFNHFFLGVKAFCLLKISHPSCPANQKPVGSALTFSHRRLALQIRGGMRIRAWYWNTWSLSMMKGATCRWSAMICDGEVWIYMGEILILIVIGLFILFIALLIKWFIGIVE